MEHNSDDIPSTSSSMRKSTPSQSSSPGSKMHRYLSFSAKSQKSELDSSCRTVNYQFESTMKSNNNPLCNAQSDKAPITSNVQPNIRNMSFTQPESRSLRSFVRLDNCNENAKPVPQISNAENTGIAIICNEGSHNIFNKESNTSAAFLLSLQNILSPKTSRCALDAPINEKTVELIPTEYFEKLLRKYSNSELCVGDSAKFSEQINETFLNCLQDIDNNADGHRDLKLITFQQWANTLLKVNHSIIDNMEELESEVAERLQCLQRKLNTDCRRSQSDELLKCRQDINSLIRIIQNAYHNDTWDFQDLSFETISLSQILSDSETSTQNMGDADAPLEMKKQLGLEQNRKVRRLIHCNIKALAIEVADKHDEIQVLKRQLVCMEDEMQNAQKKIQLKEEIIKELRSDLKCANVKLVSRNYLEANLDMPPINFENQAITCNDDAQISDRNASESITQLDSLSRSENVEQKKLKILEDELNEFLEINKECNKQKLETYRKRLSEIFHKSESEKIEAYRRLDSFRCKLMDLEASGTEGNYDCELGFCSNSENDKDLKILESLRNRLRKLNETSFELKKRVQKLELENNELNTNLTAEKEYSECNSRTLKQVADMLCNMINRQFSYTDIYNKECNTNPFCDAITQIKAQFQEQENQLFHALAVKNRKIEELGKILLDREKEFSDMRRSLMAGDCPHIVQLEATINHCHKQQSALIAATHEIIDELKNDLDEISCEAITVQQKYSEQDQKVETNLENSLKELETQNDKLEYALKHKTLECDAAFWDFHKNSESMKCQLEHMQDMISQREQKIMQLSALLSRVSHKQQGEPINAVEYCVPLHPMHSMQPMQPMPPTSLPMPISENNTIDLEKRVKHLVSALEKSRKEENFLRIEIRKINEELNESKKKNEDLTTQTRRLASLLKTQENHRMELACKYETLDKSFEDQSKKLRAATGQVRLLSDRFQLLEKRQCELNMERNLLREEVMALKEKEAILMGKQKAMQEQLFKAEKELYTAHDVVKEQQSILQRSESGHREVVKRLQETNNEMRQKMCSLMDQYKRLEEEFEKQREAFKKSEKLIESFRKWKETQLKDVERTRDTFKQYEDHIRLLLQEKQRYVQQYRDLHRDYSVIQSELDRLRICSISSMSDYNMTQVLSDKSIAQIDVIRETTRRLEEQCSSFKDEVVSKVDSLSSFKQIEETYD
uniref:Uncharacterized protein n=1 Tax=Glossina brevipalpis TaxID=37001 RepID=A0A1A9WMD1_9MUSC